MLQNLKKCPSSLNESTKKLFLTTVHAKGQFKMRMYIDNNEDISSKMKHNYCNNTAILV